MQIFGENSAQNFAKNSLQNSATTQNFGEILDDFMSAVVRKLGLKNCVINADLKITPNGGPFLIEIAPRCGGNYLYSDFVEMAVGVNIVGEWLKFCQNRSAFFGPKFFKTAFIKYFDISGEVLFVSDFKGLTATLKIAKYQCNITPGEILTAPKNGHELMWRGFAIILGENEGDCVKKGEILMSKFVVKGLK